MRLSADELNNREEELKARQQQLDAMEKELDRREEELGARNSRRKQIILRLPESLWRDIAVWAEEDFRSVNSQIEYILTSSVKQYKK